MNEPRYRKKSNGTEIVPENSFISYFLKQLQKLIHKLLETWNPFTVNCKQFPWFVTTKIKFDQINPNQNDFKSLDLCGTSHRHPATHHRCTNPALTEHHFASNHPIGVTEIRPHIKPIMPQIMSSCKMETGWIGIWLMAGWSYRQNSKFTRVLIWNFIWFVRYHSGGISLHRTSNSTPQIT